MNVKSVVASIRTEQGRRCGLKQDLGGGGCIFFLDS